MFHGYMVVQMALRIRSERKNKIIFYYDNKCFMLTLLYKNLNLRSFILPVFAKLTLKWLDSFVRCSYVLCNLFFSCSFVGAESAFEWIPFFMSRLDVPRQISFLGCFIPTSFTDVWTNIVMNSVNMPR